MDFKREEEHNIFDGEIMSTITNELTEKYLEDKINDGRSWDDPPLLTRKD